MKTPKKESVSLEEWAENLTDKERQNLSEAAGKPPSTGWQAKLTPLSDEDNAIVWQHLDNAGMDHMPYDWLQLFLGGIVNNKLSVLEAAGGATLELDLTDEERQKLLKALKQVTGKAPSKSGWQGKLTPLSDEDFAVVRQHLANAGMDHIQYDWLPLFIGGIVNNKFSVLETAAEATLELNL
jgi:hypothetical protein